MHHPEARDHSVARRLWPRLRGLGRAWVAIALTSLAGVSVCFATLADDADALWLGQVEPLLDRYCFKCHGGVRQKSGLDLRSLENILKGREGGPAIIPGKPDESRLYQFVLKGADPHMPQDERKQLKEQEINVLRAWISALPGTNIVDVPSTNRLAWVDAYLKAYREMHQPVWTPPAGMPPRQVIDRFVQVGWEQRHLEPSPQCDDRAFARRLYLDLAGRIPTSAELGAFLQDDGPDKRVRLVDALLAGAEYPRHLGEVFDVVLMERRDASVEQQRRDHGWLAFLENAFKENYP